MATNLNTRIAAKLNEAAALLDQQGGSPFRAGAYRRAAHTLAALKDDLGDVLDREGVAGLVALPGVGESIAAAVCEMIRTGRWSQLDRLRGGTEPEALFRIVPGIGSKLARRVHETLDLDTLEALETAAHDGRLATVPGFGRRRIATVKAALAEILGRLGRPRSSTPGAQEAPPMAVLLDLDREYREQAAAGRLPTIAPRRFNPEGKAWLPILHTRRNGWNFTVLFSNTPRAHELGRTGDWVVVYADEGDRRETQCTVVTETRGPLAGRRVVRGREAECAAHHAATGSTSGPPTPKAGRRSRVVHSG